MEIMPDLFRQTITSLIEALVKPERLKRDIFFAVLLLFMKENGFSKLNGKDKGTAGVIDYILSLRDKRSPIYEVEFILDGFAETPLKLIGIPVSDAVLVNAVVPSIENASFSVCLSVKKHIILYKFDVAEVFYYRELRNSFADNLVTPAKCAILNHHGFPSCNLPGLPEYITHQILLHLPVRSVLNVGESCKRLNDIVKDDRLWRLLYARDFSDFSDRKNEEKDWRDTYRELYLIRQEGLRRAHLFVRSNFEDFPDMSDDMNSSLRWQLIL